MKRIQILISGKVQGVSFRFFVYQKALALNLKGFVRNLPNGQVEIVVEGEEKVLKEFLEICKNGHPTAQVAKLEVKEYSYKKEFNDFEIKR